MGGKRNKRSSPGAASSSHNETKGNAAKVLVRDVSSIAADPILGYKMRVLIHDLLNLSKDPASARRLNTTTDEHYMSLPYFSPQEAEAVKNAIIDTEPSIRYASGHEGDGESESESHDLRLISKPVKEALPLVFSGFLEKRRASGDARPCGPHHLAPLYAALFGIDLAELQDVRFLSRLRRNGV